MKRMLTWCMIVFVTMIAISCGSPAFTNETEGDLAELGAAQPAAEIMLQIDNPLMTVDGRTLPIDEEGTVPLIQDSRTLLPVRAVVEAMGGEVAWEASSRTVTLICAGERIQLTIGEATAYHNGAAATLDALPTIINGRTMLPIRFIAERFGYAVDWDDDSREITLSQGEAAVTGSTATEPPPDEAQAATGGAKVLIAYFSRSGNTETIAGYIQELTGGELFQIETVTPYPGDYNACLEQASQELNANARPELATEVADMDSYDVILIGYPIWHGNTPMAIRSFLEAYDLTGKTIVPFATSGSSGIAASVAAIEQICVDATVLTGFHCRGSAVDNAYEDVARWLEGLELGDLAAAQNSVAITVGNQVFAAQFYDNEAAQALLAQLPLTIEMGDLNRNEKYYYLSEDLPSAQTERPATIQAGEIMCWSCNCLVLFYETFANSYSGYVRLGYVEDVAGLAQALGAGNVTVTFAR